MTFPAGFFTHNIQANTISFDEIHNSINDVFFLHKYFHFGDQKINKMKKKAFFKINVLICQLFKKYFENEKYDLAAASHI